MRIVSWTVAYFIVAGGLACLLGGVLRRRRPKRGFPVELLRVAQEWNAARPSFQRKLKIRNRQRKILHSVAKRNRSA